MSVLLRAELIAAALLVVFIIVHNVNRKRLRIQDSFLWLLIAAALAAAAFFPCLITGMCRLTGVETPANLIYLLGIFALLLIAFYQTVLISKQASQITHLIQIASIEKFLSEESEAHHDGEAMEE